MSRGGSGVEEGYCEDGGGGGSTSNLFYLIKNTNICVVTNFQFIHFISTDLL